MPRRHGPIGAELTGYREVDDGPAELRIDLVDRTAVTTVASLTPDEALALAGEILAAVARSRAPEPGE